MSVRKFQSKDNVLNRYKVVLETMIEHPSIFLEGQEESLSWVLGLNMVERIKIRGEVEHEYYI